VTNAVGGRALPGPAGGASAVPLTSLAVIRGGVLFLRGREERGWELMGKGKGEERGGKKDREGRVKKGIASSLFNFWLRACL